jgi:lipid-binding SYLF domain-containing protein
LLIHYSTPYRPYSQSLFEKTIPRNGIFQIIWPSQRVRQGSSNSEKLHWYALSHLSANSLLQIIREAYKTLDKGKIPKQAIADARGVAIFTGFRAGMYLAGAGGSGVVVARLPDGSWSPPSAFSVRSGSFGIVYGVDVYDCVCVLNTQAAV